MMDQGLLASLWKYVAAAGREMKSINKNNAVFFLYTPQGDDC